MVKYRPKMGLGLAQETGANYNSIKKSKLLKHATVSIMFTNVRRERIG